MAKKNKQLTQVYTFEQANWNKKGKNTSQTLEQGRVSEQVRVSSSHYEEGMQKEVYHKLHDNPFLYNYKKAIFKVTTVEDFYVATTRKKTSQLGAILREPGIKRGQRKKFISKGFTHWKKDFLKRKDTTFKKEDSKLSVVGEVIPPRISIGSFALLVLIFFIVSFFTFRPGEVWTLWSDKPWFQKIEAGLASATAQSWMPLAVTVTLVMVIVAMMYATVHNTVIAEFKRITSSSKALYKKYCDDIQTDFKKKFKITRRYYLKAISRKDPFKVAPLQIEKTAQGNIDFDEIQEMTDMYIMKSASIKHSKGKLKMFKFVTIYLAYLGGIGIFGFIIYSIVTSFF